MPAPILSISSSIMTQCGAPALRIAWMTLPGMARYRCDDGRGSRLVVQAAQLMRVNLRPMARAIDWPSEVLPTPGGPTRHRIGALPSGASLRTARYSTMRFLIFSNP